MDENIEIQPESEKNPEESMTSAVQNLVEDALDEASASSEGDSVAFIIEVEEEPLPVRKLPLQNKAVAAADGIKNAAGAATDTSKTVAGGAIKSGMAMAEEAIRLAEAALEFIQEENVLERTAAFLDDAEGEGKKFVNNVTGFLGGVLSR